MKKQLFAFFLILIISFVFVSCDLLPERISGLSSNTSSYQPDDQPELIKEFVSTDLSALGEGAKIEIGGIVPQTKINLSEFSLQDRIYIEVIEEGDRGADEARTVDPDYLFKREDGTFIPIPFEDRDVNLEGSELGISSEGKIIIRRFPMSNDFEIRKGEDAYKDKSSVLAEELYYVDFMNDTRFINLNRSEIVLVKTGSMGAQSYSVVQQGMKIRDFTGILDFSDKSFSGFAVNMHHMFTGKEGSKASIKLHVLSPIHVSTTEQTLTSDTNVVMVDEKASGTDYMVVVTFTGDSAAQVIRTLARNFDSTKLNPRLSNGDNRLPCVFPEFDPDGRTIKYHLGEVPESFMFNLDYNSSQTGFDSVTATVVLAEDSDSLPVNNLDCLDNVTINVPAGKILTWAFSSEDENVFSIKRTGMSMHYSVEGISGWASGFGDTRAFWGSGFFILDNYSGSSDMDMITLTRTGYQEIKCNVVEWSPETHDYVCVTDNCAFCNGSPAHYSSSFICENREGIFKNGVYWTSEEMDNEYGRICMTGGLSSGCSNKVGLGSFTVKVSNDPIKMRRWNMDDPSKMVVLDLKKLYTEDSEDSKVFKVVCDISLNDSGNPRFENVEMYFTEP